MSYEYVSPIQILMFMHPPPLYVSAITCSWLLALFQAVRQ